MKRRPFEQQQQIYIKTWACDQKISWNERIACAKFEETQSLEISEKMLIDLWKYCFEDSINPF